jgi:hypothetical protein
VDSSVWSPFPVESRLRRSSADDRRRSWLSPLSSTTFDAIKASKS